MSTSGGGHNHAHPDNTYLALLVVVAESCISVGLIAVLGWILAIKKILTPTVRKSLNKLNNSIFTPALLASKIAFSLTPERLAELWTVPVGFVIITLVSCLTAYVLGRLFKLKRSQIAFAVACASCPNANSLPVALMQSLIYSVGKELEWGKHDSKETMLGRALSYLVLFSTLGTVYRWSGAVKILAIKDEDQPIKLLDEQQGVPIASPPPAEEPSDPFSDAQNVETSTTARKKSKSRHTVFNSFPNTPNWRTPETGNSPSPSVDSEESDAESTVESEAASDQEWGSDVGLPNTTRPARSAAERKWRSVFSNAKRWALRLFWNPSKKCLKTLKEFMTVPLWSVLLSIFICFIPPVQRFLDILVPFKEALKSAGNCSIPVTLLVLGSFMNQEEEEPPSQKPSRPPHPRARTSLRKSTLPASAKEGRTIFVTVMARMVLTPAIVLPLLYWMSLSRNGVGDDPIFVVSAALLIGSPPALTLAQITDIAAPGFERLISKLMLWSYAVMTAPTTIIAVLAGLWFDQLDKHAH